MIPFIFRCAIGTVAGVVLLIVAYAIVAPFVRKWQSIRYSHILKEYYQKYGTHLLESNSLQEEIYHKVCLFSEGWGFKKDLQSVKFDIKKIFMDNAESDSKSNTVTEVAGCWIICPTRTFSIHPANMIGMSTLDSTAYIRSLIIHQNEIYYVACSDFAGQEYKNKNLLCINIANHQAKSVDYTIDWSKCHRYEISDEQNRNTLLGILCSSMATCYDMWSCALSDNKAKSVCDKYTLQLNLLLRPCEIRTKMTVDGWQFYFNNAPITLEEVIKKLPDDVLSKRLDPPPSKPPKAPTPSPKAPSKPKLSIEEELLNYLKAQPVCWDFPLTTKDKALNQFCEALVFNDTVVAVSSNEAIKNLELTIQKKRARNPRLADYNAAMEGNVLAILYEYSYLMHIFHALDDMKFDTTKVDISKLWLLIQQDCNARINNLDEENKKKNPTIQIVLNKYNYDNQITRLKVLNDATSREIDYIVSFIMAYSLLTSISLLLGNPKLLQPLKPYPADDIAGMMNAFVCTAAGIRFTAYSR